MNLKVIGTGSQGNAYLLETKDEALLIECGVRFDLIKKALDFNLSKVVGCLVTHEHGDHAKAVKDVLNAGIDVYTTDLTHKAMNTSKHHRSQEIDGRALMIGDFKVMAFDVKHDAADPSGFLIYHPECGKVLFLTDTFYSPYTFEGLNNIIIEANFSKEIMKRRLSDMEFLKNRILQSHMSIETCCDFLRENDTSQVNNVVLIHLSDGNSNEVAFKKQAQAAVPGKKVTVASNGMKINFNKTPF